LEEIKEKKLKEIFKDFEDKNIELIQKLKEKAEISYQITIDNQNVIDKNKKDFILHLLSTKVKFYFIRFNNLELLKFINEASLLPVKNEETIEKYLISLKNNENLILILFDNSTKNFKGFGRLIKKNLEDFNINSIMVPFDWIWKTNIDESKLNFLKNNDGIPIINYNDGQEIQEEIGKFICKYMIKKLNKNEYLAEKK